MTRVTYGDRLRRAVVALAMRRHDDRGATAVEYALMLALIAVVIVGAVTVLGQQTSEPFVDVAVPLAGS